METRSRSRKKNGTSNTSPSTSPSTSAPPSITCYHGRGDQQKKLIVTWDPDGHAHVKEVKQKQVAATLYSYFITTAYALWLPRNYPHSVTPDYVPFQIWDTLQAVSSYLRGLLCTQAVLVGLGVGESTASATSATMTWIIRDGLGMLGGMIFASTQGSKFGYEIKKWRLFADVINDVGLTCELIAPLIPSYFLYFVVIGSICRSLCGVAAGASRAALMNHFARTGDVADISAKEGVQETTVTLFGLVAGLYCTSWLDGSQCGTWIVFITLTIFHVYANYQAMSVLCLSSLNEQRLTHLITSYITSPSAPLMTPIDMSRHERILWWSSPTPPIIRSVPLIDVLNHSWEELMSFTCTPIAIVDTSNTTPRYLLTIKPHGILITYHINATSLDYLQSLFHAHCVRLSHDLSQAQVTYVHAHFARFLDALHVAGWNTQHLAMEMGDDRADW